MPTKGRYVDALDNNNNLLYPKTVATQVIYSPNKSVRKKIEEIDTSVTDVKLSVKAVTDEVVEARDDDTTIHLTLKKRLDSMRDKTNTIEKEVKDARTKNGVVYDSLSDRLSATDGDVTNLKTEINNAKGGEPTLADKINSLSDGNQLTLDEVIEARNGETKLDVRLDKMQQTITEVTNQVTLATTDDLGVTHANLRVRLDKMRKDAKRTDDEVVEARTSVKHPNAPFANLKARLDAMENETDKISNEINDASNGFVSLDDRLDKMQDEIANAVGGNYLPLTGGTLTGDLTINALTTFGGNALHDGGNITISSNAGSYLYNINSHQRGTVKIGSPTATESIITTDTPQLTVKDFLTITDEDVKIYRADHQAGWRIGSSQNGYSYIAPVSNGNPLWNDGIRFQAQRAHGGEDYQNVTILSTNVQPLEDVRGDLGGSTIRWKTIWGEVLNTDKITSKNANVIIEKPTQVNGELVAQDGQIRTNGWGKSMIMSTGRDHTYLHNTGANSYLTFYDNGQLRYSGEMRVLGTMYIDGNCIPSSPNNQDLGYMNERWQTIWGNDLRIGRVFNDRGNLLLDSVGGSTQCNGTFAPNRDNAFHLGIDVLRWVQVWTVNGVMQGSDENIKEDIREVQDEDFFNMIKDVEVKSYLYKEPSSEASTLELVEEEDKEPRTQDNVEDNDLNVGIIAQDMAKHDVSKYVLNHSEEGGYSINLYNYSASLHSALRHEIKKREELEKEFAEFKELVNKKLGVI